MIDLENSIIVVEGASDVQFLSTFVKSTFQITNGSSVPRETLEYLKEASKTKNIIVLTDPDYPGEKIRKTINGYIPSSLNAYVRKENSIKKNKVGVAESTKEEVLESLSKIKVKDFNQVKGSLTTLDLYNLGLVNNKELRENISLKLKLGKCNAKTMYKRLLNNNIKLKQLCEIIK